MLRKFYTSILLRLAEEILSFNRPKRFRLDVMADAAIRLGNGDRLLLIAARIKRGLAGTGTPTIDDSCVRLLTMPGSGGRF